MSSTETTSSSEEEQPRKPRHFKERINFQVDNFVECFRLSRERAGEILREVGGALAHASSRNNALTSEQQLLATLRYLATNGFYHVVAEAHGVHKSTICRTIPRVVQQINSVFFDREIRWPETVQECNQIPLEFYRKGGMPCVAGAIDGTHIPISKPTRDEYQYANRKGHHSINSLMVCGPNLEFYFVSARWPGSVNDGRILKNSNL